MMAALLFFGACSSTDNKDSNDSHTKEAEHETHEHAKRDEVRLNKGERWKVNDGMRPFVEQGDSILEGYVSSKGENYQELAEQLKQKNNNLIKNCTMTGESHDQLHKWLMPHIQLIQELSEADNLTDAGNLLDQIKLSFATYKEYFE